MGLDTARPLALVQQQEAEGRRVDRAANASRLAEAERCRAEDKRRREFENRRAVLEEHICHWQELYLSRGKFLIPEVQQRYHYELHKFNPEEKSLALRPENARVQMLYLSEQEVGDLRVQAPPVSCSHG